MSISFREMLGANSILDVPVAHQQHMQSLLPKVNNVLAAYDIALGKHFVAIVSSGYRSLQHHINVYKKKFYKTHEASLPFDSSTVPMGSKHLTGNAVDIADPTGELYKYLADNQQVLVAAGLYMEKNTKGWVHLQDLPPRSGVRIFLP